MSPARPSDDADPPEEETRLNRFSAPPPASASLRPRPRVRWSDGSGAHTLVLLDRTMIGSAAKAGLVVNDPTVSRIHAELQEVDGHVWVRDLGSRNGTYVDGVLVGSARVREGGVLRVGSTELRITCDASAPEREEWPDARFGPMLGRSQAMRQLFAQLAKVAATSSSVLVRGETGTGKELVARAIHEASPRATQPFVIIDCAALPEQLLEAELFGHARGAFTGAERARTGAFEAAHGGTIFLDEIGELPLTMQPKLLRAIESRSIRVLGENHHRPIDVRIVSATHRDLRTMVNAGAFREDLYFRLAVLPVEIPPLRDRPEDVPALVEHFLPPNSAQLSPSLLEDLARQPWLGNVRELRNFVERAVAFGPRSALAMGTGAPTTGSVATPEGITPSDLERDYRSFREAWLDRGERQYVQHLLQVHGGVVSAAASAAGLDRTYFYKLMRRLGIASGVGR